MLVLIVAFFATVIGIIFVTLGQRKIPIQHVRKIVGNKMTQGGTSYLPFRVASAGVIPIIFALSIQLLPLTFAAVRCARLRICTTSCRALPMPCRRARTRLTGLVYAAIIVFFTYFYTAVTMNVEQIADDLKKYGSFIPGIRPGKATHGVSGQSDDAHHPGGRAVPGLDRPAAVLDSGADQHGGPSGFTLVGGTSLLIVVGVALETMQAIEAQLLMRNYEGFIR